MRDNTGIPPLSINRYHSFFLLFDLFLNDAYFWYDTCFSSFRNPSFFKKKSILRRPSFLNLLSLVFPVLPSFIPCLLPFFLPSLPSYLPFLLSFQSFLLFFFPPVASFFSSFLPWFPSSVLRCFLFLLSFSSFFHFFFPSFIDCLFLFSIASFFLFFQLAETGGDYDDSALPLTETKSVAPLTDVNIRYRTYLTDAIQPVYILLYFICLFTNKNISSCSLSFTRELYLIMGWLL